MSKKAKTNGISADMVIEALRNVQDPELKQDLVSLNMIRDLSVEEGVVSFTLMLTTPACPLREKITNDARAAVEALPGVRAVRIDVQASVPAGQLPGKLNISVKNSLAIASGKGGVGKSTVAVNVSIALASAGSRVGLLDADIYGPNIPTMMGLSDMPNPSENRLIPAEAFGVKVLSIGLMVKPGQPLIWRGPMLHSAIRQFLVEVEWGDLDYLVMDLPPGTGDVQLSLCQLLALTGGLIVTMPQKVSLEDARRGLEMFRILDVPLIGVVENMSYWIDPEGRNVDLFGRGGGKHLAEETGVPFLGEIPIDPRVRVGGDSGKPVIVDVPESPAADALRKIAGQTAARISQIALGSTREKRIPGES